MTKEEKLDALNQMNKNTLMETLGIHFTDVTDDYLEATMPVDSRVHQPYGILHGGASFALAETVGSVLSAVSVDMTKFKSVGMQMTANHIKPVREGVVTARAEFIRKGRTSNLVKIEIKDDEGRLICYCLLTNSIVAVDYV